MRDAILKHLDPYIEQKAEEKAEQKIQAAIEKAIREERTKKILTAFSLGLPFDLMAQIFPISIDEIKEILKEQQVLTD